MWMKVPDLGKALFITFFGILVLAFAYVFLRAAYLIIIKGMYTAPEYLAALIASLVFGIIALFIGSYYTIIGSYYLIQRFKT